MKMPGNVLPVAETVLLDELKQQELFFIAPAFFAVKDGKMSGRFEKVVVIFLVITNLG